jgi:hypothetical protein
LTYIIRNGRDTGNIFAEIKCNGIPSAISTTKSDFFIYMFFHLGEIWIIRPEKFREIIKRRRNEFELSKNVAQGKRVSGFKVPRDKVKDDFKVIKFELEIVDE